MAGWGTDHKGTASVVRMAGSTPLAKKSRYSNVIPAVYRERDALEADTNPLADDLGYLRIILMRLDRNMEPMRTRPKMAR